jgi:hypothetical protein
MDIRSDTILRAHSPHPVAELGEEIVFLDMERGVYYGLTDVAASAWRRLQEPMRFEDLVQAVMEEYEVDRERCEADLRTFLEQLNQKGLVTADADPAGAE